MESINVFFSFNMFQAQGQRESIGLICIAQKILTSWINYGVIIVFLLRKYHLKLQQLIAQQSPFIFYGISIECHFMT